MSTEEISDEQSIPNNFVPHIKPHESAEDEIPQPYDRYDSPYYIPANNEALLYGSVTGMALQDRPLKQMQAEESSIYTSTLQHQQLQQQQQQQQQHQQISIVAIFIEIVNQDLLSERHLSFNSSFYYFSFFFC